MEEDIANLSLDDGEEEAWQIKLDGEYLINSEDPMQGGTLDGRRNLVDLNRIPASGLEIRAFYKTHILGVR
ncbi:hypothetical protein J1N35_039128 [Gossypium stocksii]|uniref:Uncharacterized protein n=1 Tax=Gossypium stocksii TaxID=47602 RepID=A0A9D3UQ54_9ROSI|nr:hypothetical protein J1N35_039128 [Gossypium stocksii]